MSSIDSPSRSGISRNAPLKLPSKANVICSSTSREPSSSISTLTSAWGRVKD
jgi:hypothetical protein